MGWGAPWSPSSLEPVRTWTGNLDWVPDALTCSQDPFLLSYHPVNRPSLELRLKTNSNQNVTQSQRT